MKRVEVLERGPRDRRVGAGSTAAPPVSAPSHSEDVPTEAAADHGLRLLRSHAGAIGAELPEREVRAMLAVPRANQLLAGGAGLRHRRDGLCRRWRNGARPGGQRAQLGRHRRHRPRWPRWAWRSRANTPGAARGTAPEPQPLATTTRWPDLVERAHPRPVGARPARTAHALTATQLVAALSLLAVDGSYEAYALPVPRGPPPPGLVRRGANMRATLGAPDRHPRRSAASRDPYGFRCVPQIHGPAHDAADALETC